MSSSCKGMLKITSGMEVVSNRWESIRSLFKGYIPVGSRHIWVQSFDRVTSSNLKWSTCCQIWVFLAALIDSSPWTVADTSKVKLIFEMTK